MLHRLATLISLYRVIDFVVDHRDQIQQWAPGVGFAMTWLFSAWAWISGQPPVIIITIAFAIFAATLVIMVEIPPWLEKYKPRPFAVDAEHMLHSKQSLSVIAQIVNRSKHDRVVLEFSFFLKAEGRPETWFPNVKLEGIERNLGPQESTEGHLSIHIPSPELLGTDYTGNADFETQLHVKDRISGRWATFKIPGSYPPRS